MCLCVQTEDEVFNSQMILRNTERKRAITLTGVESSQGGDFDFKKPKKVKRSESPEMSVITEMKSKMEDQAKEIAKLRKFQNNNESMISSMNNSNMNIVKSPVTPAGQNDDPVHNGTVNESSGRSSGSKSTGKKWLIF